MAGFNIPAEVLESAGLPEAGQGVHLARRPLGAVSGPDQTQPVQPRGDGSGQRDQRHRPVAPSRTPALSDATISMGGFPAALRDTRDYYEHDIRFIIIATLIVVLLTLMVLLRAIVAPLYLVGHRGDFVLRGDGHRCAVPSSSSSASSCIGACRRWRSWSWWRWAPTTTCCLCRACGTSLPTQRALRHHPHLGFDGWRHHRGGTDLRRVDGRTAVLQHRHRGPGRLRDRCGNPAGHLRGAHHHRARHRGAGGAGELVAVTSGRTAAMASQSPPPAEPAEQPG